MTHTIPSAVFISRIVCLGSFYINNVWVFLYECVCVCVCVCVCIQLYTEAFLNQVNTVMRAIGVTINVTGDRQDNQYLNKRNPSQALKHVMHK